MAKHSYPGLTDPKSAFEALRPYDKALIDMMTRVRPWGPDYMILDAARKALATAAYHFTREPDLYSAKPHRQFGGPGGV